MLAAIRLAELHDGVPALQALHWRLQQWVFLKFKFSIAIKTRKHVSDAISFFIFVIFEVKRTYFHIKLEKNEFSNLGHCGRKGGN